MQARTYGSLLRALVAVGCWRGRRTAGRRLLCRRSFPRLPASLLVACHRCM